MTIMQRAKMTSKPYDGLPLEAWERRDDARLAEHIRTLARRRPLSPVNGTPRHDRSTAHAERARTRRTETPGP